MLTKMKGNNMIDNNTIKLAKDMRKAHLNLAQHAIDNNYSISVRYDFDDDDGCTKSTDFKTIKDAVEATDESHMYIYDNQGKKIAWALIILGNEDNELVSDYSVCSFMDSWFDNFQKMYEETE